MSIWNPTTHGTELAMGEVYEDMKVNYRHLLERVPLSIKLMENPWSPIHLPGANSLRRHDLTHIVLGTDTSLEGECLVVGFTMGSANSVRPRHFRVFKWWVMHIYPSAYRPDKAAWAVFDQAAELAKQMGVKNLHLAKLERQLSLRVREVQEKLGIDPEKLEEFRIRYFREKEDD